MRRSAALLLLLALALGLPVPLSLRAAEINGNLTIHGSVNGATTTGTGAAYLCAPSPPLRSYRTGTAYSFIAHTANTGAVSINYNGLGARTIKKVIAGVVTDLVANDILAGMPVVVVYDGTVMRLVSPNALSIQAIASGTIALATAAIASGACATEQTATATGVVTTDTVLASFNGDVTGVTGYTASTSGTLRVDVYPKSGQVGLRVCNNTASSITPGAVTLNFRVVR